MTGRRGAHAGRSVSLALGSGGARGLAHIGVIGWLEENGYAIRSIAGSSMGALVGGIYASGKLDAYAHWVRAVSRADVVRFIDFSFERSGFIKGQRIIDLLRELVGERSIEELPLPFAAVATDVAAGEEVWITRGPLFEAIRASIAMPTFFTPHVVGGRRLLDGGIMNPLPVASPVRRPADFCVAVSLNGRPGPMPPAEAASPGAGTENGYRQAVARFMRSIRPAATHGELEDWGLLDVVNRSFDTVQGALTRLLVAASPPDVLVEIPRSSCGAFEFHRAEEMIELGRRAAAAAMGARGARAGG